MEKCHIIFVSLQTPEWHCTCDREWILDSLGPHTSQDYGDISLSLHCNLNVGNLIILILLAVTRSLYCEVAIFLFVISEDFSRQLF